MVVRLGRAQLILNDRVNQSPATPAPRAVLHRTPCGCAVAVQASLHREANRGLEAARPATSGSRPVTGDTRAAQAGKPRGPDGSRRGGARAVGPARVPLR